MSNRFANLRANKKVKFVGLDIEISKLSTADVLEIQELTETVKENKDEKGNIELMLTVIRKGVQEMKDMTSEELLALPMEDLSQLSAEIMQFSGLGKTE